MLVMRGDERFMAGEEKDSKDVCDDWLIFHSGGCGVSLVIAWTCHVTWPCITWSDWSKEGCETVSVLFLFLVFILFNGRLVKA